MGEEIADVRELKDLPFKNPETRIVPIRGVNFEVYEELPYIVGSKVADLWIRSMMGAKSIVETNLSGTLNEILLAVVVKPKLTMEFIESDRCPNEFVSIAMSHFTKIIQSFNLLNNNEEVEIVENEELEEEI